MSSEAAVVWWIDSRIEVQKVFSLMVMKVRRYPEWSGVVSCVGYCALSGSGVVWIGLPLLFSKYL